MLIFICFLILACHLTFTIIFYCDEVMNTFIQWQETISGVFLTDTLPYFPFIELDISLLPQGSLASIPSKALTLEFDTPKIYQQVLRCGLVGSIHIFENSLLTPDI